MKVSAVQFCSFVIVTSFLVSVYSTATAGEYPRVFRCSPCDCGAACGPYGNTGCGPRYWGAVPEEGRCPDPCDKCNRWRTCYGSMPGSDLLAPWQMPPGRGFMPPEYLGYDTRSACHRCRGGH
ncbi:MAG: hypothetical protein ABGW78_15195 [Pirellulales bacterium]